ncbi:scarecrow-like protein 14 [Selaginella moellendorffii]|nr:scarecrow-like protein 14 [Selaginella moellendorffii]|eukprot:XP_024525989.1 scarecrow-like protein 14 [Selaginella moellendorffii]
MDDSDQREDRSITPEQGHGVDKSSDLEVLEHELMELIGLEEPDPGEQDSSQLLPEEEPDLSSSDFGGFATMRCSLSTNVLDNPECDVTFDASEDEDSSMVIQPEVAWMIDSPVGLQWPKPSPKYQHEEDLQQQPPSLLATGKGTYYQVLESVGLPSLDLVEQLVECARAVSSHDVMRANLLVEEIRSKVSPLGTSTQRIVYYFVEALVARVSATGNGLFTAMCHARPTAGAMLKSVEYIMERSPFLSVRYFFPNQVILNACRGHQRIHIVDYGACFGFQWPALMQELANTPGGPPYLRITGIDSPLPGGGSASDVGCMLREYAQSIGLPFKFRAVSKKWENIDAATLLLSDDEVLAVNCMFRQTNLLDESVLAESPRKMWLNRVRSLNPRVFIQGMNNASYNVPFFMTRFLEALTHFALLFDAIDCCSQPESKERHLLEQEKYGREIVNIVACEGLERVERAETYKQWHSRTQRAKFELLNISDQVFHDTESLMGMYHQSFELHRDQGWLLLGWKGQILHAFSGWRPSSS